MADAVLVESARESLLKVETLREKREELAQQHAEERADVCKPVKKALTTLEKRQKAESDALEVRIKEVETECRAKVIAIGETVKGETLQCCYQAGRTTWNGDKLDGMSVALPQILSCRSVGDPITVIRKVGKGD